MDIVINAIVLKSVDYKDNDKILTLYSPEKGKITAGIKGVKKSGAKLKFASEPFALCEFVLAERAGRYTVIGATYIESFFNLRLNLLKYYASSVVLEIMNLLTPENEPDAELFSLAVNTVKYINYQDAEVNTLCAFMLEFVAFLGYGIEKINCSGCDCIATGRVFFSAKFAQFYCMSCYPGDGIEITLETYQSLYKIFNKPLSKVVEVELQPKSALKLFKFLNYYLSLKTESTIKSASALVEFLS